MRERERDFMSQIIIRQSGPIGCYSRAELAQVICLFGKIYGPIGCCSWAELAQVLCLFGKIYVDLKDIKLNVLMYNVPIKNLSGSN